MICENCSREHNGSYGSGRFCSTKCARGFSTKEKRKEINRKVSIKLLKNQPWNKGEKNLISSFERRKLEKHASYIRETETKSIMDLSKRTTIKILKRMNLPCSYCGWTVKGAVGDVHHIIEKKNGGTDDMDNITYICPNCHRLVHSNIIKKDELVTLQDYIGESWKEFYYIKNGKFIEGSVPPG
jgi:hypothetical protein